MTKQEFCFIKFAVAPLWILVNDFLQGSCAIPLKNLLDN